MTQKVEGFAVGLIGISQFSPESFQGVAVFITNAIPDRIVFPIVHDMLDKLRVFFPVFMEDFKDDKRNLAGRALGGLTILLPLVGTGDMTRKTTAPQRGIIGERCRTDHTWWGLSHQAKGSKSGLGERIGQRIKQWIDQKLKLDGGDDPFFSESAQFVKSELVT